MKSRIIHEFRKEESRCKIQIRAFAEFVIYSCLMNPYLQIIEIGERPPTGVSSCPFRCVGEDGFGYYVKLGTALPDERIAEWMFGFLADKMGLPTPVGRLVQVDEALSRSSALDTVEFGYGIGFGSREIIEGDDLSAVQIDLIPRKIRAETLIFDWWIGNEDRKLGAIGGNSNLLIDPNDDVFLIDHGNALDPDFDEAAFFEGHAFALDRSYWDDSGRRKDWSQRAQKVARYLSQRWLEIPDEWLDENPTTSLDSIEANLSLAWESYDLFWESFLR